MGISFRTRSLALVAASVLLFACGEASETELLDSGLDSGLAEPICGDGLLEGDEECDDGNAIDGDGCSSGCLLEAKGCEDDDGCEDGERCQGGLCAQAECERDEDCGGIDECSDEIFCDTERAECVRVPARADGERCEHPSGAISSCLVGECLPLSCEEDADCDNGVACDGIERCEAGSCFAGSAAADGTPCEGGGRCVEASCLPAECANDEGCESANECREDDVCDLMTLQCVRGAALVGEACDGGLCDPSGECAAPGCGNGVLEAGEHCDDWNVLNGDGCSSRCRLETALRAQQLELVDPHFHSYSHLSGSLREAVGTCQDFTNDERLLTMPLGMTPVTIPAVNDLLGGALFPGEGGAIPLSVLIVVDSIGEPGAEHPFSVHGASCERVDGGCTGPELLTDTSYEDGRCFDLTPGTASEVWAADLNAPSERCFRSADAPVSLHFAGLELSLESAVFAGEWQGTPAYIERGVLRGFLKESVADQLNLLDALEVANVSGVLSLSTFLPGGKASVVDALVGPLRLAVTFGSCLIDHEGAPHFGKDTHEGEPGWWFHLNYEAAPLLDLDAG